MPISLVISLSQTIKGLHWDKIPGDNDGEVAARGILYLLIFQQLGQLVRWSWGYHVLLAPPDKFNDENAFTNSQAEGPEESYSDLPYEQTGRLIDDSPTADAESLRINGGYNREHAGEIPENLQKRSAGSLLGESGERTPITYKQYTSSASSTASSSKGNTDHFLPPSGQPQAPINGNTALPAASDPTTSGSFVKSTDSTGGGQNPLDLKGWLFRGKRTVCHGFRAMWRTIRATGRSLIQFLPTPAQEILWQITRGFIRFWLGVWDFMNPPLWAMLAAIIVASIPSLQNLFFSEGTFVKNSITSAIRQMGGVAVPLILVVLGANLEGKTQPEDPHHSEEDDKEETKLLIACLVSRMLLPILIMAPLLALAAKYIPVSILDDPIFVVVCFLLTGAPSALQLAQICQINGVYLGTMSRLLFQSYVVWYAHLTPTPKRKLTKFNRILPSTLVLVVLAIESLEYAQR